MQVILLTMVLIGIYKVIDVIIKEYAHDKNMHEQRARTKRHAALRVVQKGREGRVARGRQRSDSGMCAERSHANCGPSTGRGYAQKSYGYSQRKHDLYPSSVYTHIPNSKITPLHPLCKISKSPLKRFFCHDKVYTLYVLI